MVFFHHINFATDEPHNTCIQLFRLLSYTFVLTLIHALLLFLAPKKIPFHEKIYASSIYLWLPLLPIMVYWKEYANSFWNFRNEWTFYSFKFIFIHLCLFLFINVHFTHMAYVNIWVFRLDSIFLLLSNSYNNTHTSYILHNLTTHYSFTNLSILFYQCNSSSSLKYNIFICM